LDKACFISSTGVELETMWFTPLTPTPHQSLALDSGGGYKHMHAHTSMSSHLLVVWRTVTKFYHFVHAKLSIC